MRKTPLCCSLLMMFSLSGLVVGCAPEAKSKPETSAKSTDDKKSGDSAKGTETAKGADPAKLPAETKKKAKKAPSDSSTLGGGVENVPAAGGVEEKPEAPGSEPPKN